MPVLPEPVPIDTPLPRAHINTEDMIADDDDSQLQVRFSESNVGLEVFGRELVALLGFESGSRPTGTLSITTHLLYWYTAAFQRGFSVDYRSVILHAISRARPEVPSLTKSAVYLQLELRTLVTADGDQLPLSSTEEEEEEHDQSEPISELKFYPEHDTSVDRIFMALTECVSMYPCLDDEDVEDEALSQNGGNSGVLPFALIDEHNLLPRGDEDNTQADSDDRYANDDFTESGGR